MKGHSKSMYGGGKKSGGMTKGKGKGLIKSPANAPMKGMKKK